MSLEEELKKLGFSDEFISNITKLKSNSEIKDIIIRFHQAQCTIFWQLEQEACTVEEADIMHTAMLSCQ